jgi:CBS domain-containing protein
MFLLAGCKLTRFTPPVSQPILNRHTMEQNMNARDIMSSPVISVGPQTPVLQIAALLREQRIGGVPVLDENELVGIVTEKDLLHRREIGTEHRSQTQAWWRRVVGPDLEPERYVKSHGRCAEHVMTRIVVVVEPDTSLRTIMALFDRNRIGRVPVLVNGRIVGIVTSADLVKALAEGIWVSTASRGTGSDEEIRRRLLSELAGQEWWNGGCCALEVVNGVVRFTGFFEGEAQRRASRVAAENIPGVQRVEDERRSIAELPTMF